MLNKLLKHEFRATGRIMLPLLGLLVLLSVLAGVSAKVIDSDMSAGFLELLSMLFIIAFFLGLFAAAVIAFVLMIQRFYKNLMCDEGYLMMTLPVSVDQHIFSKLIVSSVWFAVTGIICALSMLIMVLTNAEALDFNVFIQGFQGITEYVSVLNIIGYILEAIVLFFVASCATCLHIYAAIAIGHTFSNHKVLLSVVFYFVLSFLLSALQMVIAWISDKAGLIGSFTSFMDATTPADFTALLHWGMLGLILYSVVLAAVCYLPTKLLLKNKLNLA